MKQHPIPQDITGYKFHLIGSMTLKQFGELTIGAIFAFIVSKSNLIGIVKWPIFIFTIILSMMIAFVPIEERPLDFWIVTFFKNLWKPTKFFWKRTPKIPDFFNFKANQNQKYDVTPEVNYSPARKKRIQEYLKSIPATEENLDEWDLQFKQKAQDLMANFNQVTIKKENISIQRENNINKPQLKTRIRKIKTLEKIQEQQEKQTRQENEIPSIQPIAVENNHQENTEKKLSLSMMPKQDNIVQKTNLATPPANSTILTTDEQSAQQKEAQRINQLTGAVFDQQNKPVGNALIEVFAIDQDQALRISKSDSNGQFYIKTALPNGEYLIKTEAENFEFDPISIRLTGRPTPSITINAN